MASLNNSGQYTEYGEPAKVEPNFLEVTSGIKNWLFTLDHKRIGIMYLTGILAALIVGGAFAMLVRIELWTPGTTIIGQQTYNEFFTVHGALMVFLVIIPGIPAALGNFVLPMQLGAPDVAFPRLNLASFYLWCIGASCLLATLALGSVDTGWTFYTPYSIDSSPGAVIPAVLGVFFLGFSSIFTGLNFIVTIHKFRPRGMGWFKMPLNLWGIYATALLQVIATPVLGITVLLLFVEKFAAIGIFDPTLGGDPVLFQHFFWFYSHPAVYIMILPAMAVISELITVFSRKHIFGYKFIAYSSLSLALLSFLVWGHHLFVSGQSALATMVFSALTFTVGIPSAIKVFNWLATLYKGAIHLKTPMLYALSFILLFTIGGLTGLFLGVLAVDVHLHDTYFVVAHFHYVMMGSTLVAFLGALHYWWPKITARMYPERLGQITACIVFFAFNLTFLPQFVMGTKGMPRRYWDYDPEFTFYHQMSTVGALILGIALCAVVGYLVWSLKNGKKAPANPWGSTTMEWMSPSPPPLYNFSSPPEMPALYDYENLVYVPEIEGWVYKRDADGDDGGGADHEEAAEASAPETEPKATAPEAEPEAAAPETEPEAAAPEAEPEAAAPEAEAASAKDEVHEGLEGYDEAAADDGDEDAAAAAAAAAADADEDEDDADADEGEEDEAADEPDDAEADADADDEEEQD